MFNTVRFFGYGILGLLATFGIILLSGSARTSANTDTQFQLPAGGVSVLQTGGTGTTVTTGFARIKPDSGSAYPGGVAIFSLRQNGVLVTEAAVSAATPTPSGRIYAEIGGGVDTGLAIANPNAQTANISFFFTDSSGTQAGATGSLTIPANGKTAAFLSQPPFNGPSSFLGTFTYISSVPVAITALRGLTNARGEFLITTLPVSPASSTQKSSLYIPHFADGGGWRTQVILVNPTGDAIGGAIRFKSQGSTTVSGRCHFRSFLFDCTPKFLPLDHGWIVGGHQIRLSFDCSDNRTS